MRLRALGEEGLEVGPALDARKVGLGRALHVGVHHSWSDAVDEHAVRRERHRSRARDRIDSRLARRIGRIVRKRHARGRRGDVDDPAGLLVAHQAAGRGGQHRQRRDVDGERPLP